VRPARKPDNLTAICEPIVKKMWEPRRLTTLWASTTCYSDSFTFTLLYMVQFLIAEKQLVIYIHSVILRRSNVCKECKNLFLNLASFFFFCKTDRNSCVSSLWGLANTYQRDCDCLVRKPMSMCTGRKRLPISVTSLLIEP
jgi:hypothetical protein